MRSKHRAVPRLALLAIGCCALSLASVDAFAQEPAPPPAADPPKTSPFQFSWEDAGTPATPATPPPPPAAPPPAPVEPTPPVPVAAEPPPKVEPPPPPSKARRRHRRERGSANSDPPQPWFRAALYPAVKSGYVSGESTFMTPTGSEKVDANTVAIEPHMDALLVFKGLIGVGASGGYLWAAAKGLGGWTFTPFVMLAITPSLSLKANYGILEGTVDYEATSMGTISLDTSAKRYGGGIFYILSSSDSTSIGLGLEVLRMESPIRDNASYGGTGGFADLAISFDD